MYMCIYTLYNLIIIKICFRVQGEEELKAEFGERISCVTLDISDNKRCRDVISEIAAKHDNLIHTLFNCAVYFGSRGEQMDLRS